MNYNNNVVNTYTYIGEGEEVKYEMPNTFLTIYLEPRMTRIR